MPTEKNKKEKVTAKAVVAPAATETLAAKVDSLQKRKVLVGKVVSDKMQKTIVVKVERRVRHALYKKYVVRSTRFKVHDERNEAKEGDLVSVVESRPLSRDKRWVLQSIVRRTGQVLELSV